MIIWNLFGYALRHKIYYETKIKSGTIKLWSSYNGALTGADPTVNGDSFLSKYEALHGAINDGFFGVNQYTEFKIGDEKDILSILAALIVVRTGIEFSFLSKEGRKISLSLAKEGKWGKDIITVQVQYGNSGKLTLDEANELGTTLREILRKLGHSDQEISEQLERITKDCLA